MRIAQVAPLYESVPPKLYGGTERVVSYLTEALVRQGQQVTLFASGDSVTSAELRPMCPSSLRLNKHCVDSLAHHVLMLERVALASDEFDIIHWHTDYLHFPLSRRMSCPGLTTLHGRLDIVDLIPVHNEFRDMPLVSISDAQRSPMPWANWQGTIHHGLPPDLYSLHPEPGKYLAFIGRISPEKRADRAIQIAKQTGIPLKIAAKIDKVDQEYFDARIKPLLDTSLVEFIGEIGDADKNEFLGKAAALLFPIDWPEPFGMVMIEAMACGTPVIAWPCGSVKEVIDPGKTGFVVESVAEAIEAIRQIDSLDRRVCRQVFEERFTSDRMAQDYIALYSNCIARDTRTAEENLVERSYPDQGPALHPRHVFLGGRTPPRPQAG